MVKISIGENIKRRRTEKNMLQADLAKNVGVTQALICQIEKGIKMPSMVTGNLIAKELGCTVEDLLADGR